MIKGKWKPIILWRLRLGVTSLAKLERDIDGITQRLMNSVSAQVSYYSAFIQNNPEWEYAGVYADCGISGTGTARRGESK